MSIVIVTYFCIADILLHSHFSRHYTKISKDKQDKVSEADELAVYQPATGTSKLMSERIIKLTMGTKNIPVT